MTVGGAVAAATPELLERVKHMQNVHGNIMAPQNAFYTLQTTKTLGLRIARQSATAMKVAQFLEKHPAVDVVRYPGLDSFPQKELADRQHNNGVHGSMLWFEVKGGTASHDRTQANPGPAWLRPWVLPEEWPRTLPAHKRRRGSPLPISPLPLSTGRHRVGSGNDELDPAAVVPVREPGRDRVDLHVPVRHDARQHVDRGSAEGGHHRRLRSHLVRSRGPR